MMLLTVIGMIFVLCSGAFALEKLVETVAKGCQQEIQDYCKNVTPGEGRILACLYAHQDKLSGRCEAQLERVIAALTYVANECKDDLKAYCSDVAIGKGRLLKCLEKNDAKVSDRCKQARKDVKLEYKK
jgi:hypothetical protein